MSITHQKQLASTAHGPKERGLKLNVGHSGSIGKQGGTLNLNMPVIRDSLAIMLKDAAVLSSLT